MDDDYGDLASQYAGGQGQQPAPPPEPFTQADSMRLQKLQAGLSSVQDQVDDGTLTAAEGQQFTQAIQAMSAPLSMKQQRAKQQQQQEAYADLQQQSAHLEAIQHANAAFRAGGFRDTMAQHVDPLTGEVVHFYQHEPGNWKQVDQPKQQAALKGAGSPS